MKTRTKNLSISFKRLSLGLTNLFLFACSLQSGPSKKISVTNRQSRIVNGQIVEASDSWGKMAVLIRNKLPGDKYYICSGVLIHRKVVLSAAHCVKPNALQTEVIFSSDFRNPKPGHTIQVVRSFTHPQYQPQPLNQSANLSTRNDVALFVLEQQAPTDYKTIKMARALSSAPNYSLTVLGFGTVTTMGGPKDGLLRKKDLVSEAYSPREIYFLAQQTDGGICDSDSGGPAFITKDSDRFLVGISGSVLFGANPNPCKNESSFANVPFYADWISQELKKLN